MNGPHDKKLFLFPFYLSHAVKLVLVQIAVTKAEDTMQGINRYCIILLCRSAWVFPGSSSGRWYYSPHCCSSSSHHCSVHFTEVLHAQ